MKTKSAFIIVCLAAMFLILNACTPTSPEEQEPVIPSGKEHIEVSPTNQAIVDTEFARILEMVPYSFLKEHDIWFGNPGKVRQLYGKEHVNSIDAAKKLSSEELQAIQKTLAGVAAPDWKNLDLAKFIGFDGWMANCNVFAGILPPWSFSINEGDFDEDSITAKLTEQGYEKKDFGSYTYYAIYDDFQINPLSDMANLGIMAGMNRIVVLDDVIITAPATDIMTDILETMVGNEEAVIDNPVCKALAASLGEVLSSVIITPDRVVDPAGGDGEILPFDFAIPSDWGQLHQYDMVGMGYRDDGEERYWVISLYYSDAISASADAGELEKRMGSYSFYTQYKDREKSPLKVTPLTDQFEVGEPAVQVYSGGATLTVACRYKPETENSAWLTHTSMMRDLLFLVPDPSLFVGE